MLAIERRSQILSMMEETKSVHVSDIARTFSVTEETIRRDLEKLEKEGLVIKTYGGAVLAEGLSANAPYKVRFETNKTQKQEIARKILDLVNPKDSIMLDASSTCVNIAKRLARVKQLTIITNSVEILVECAANENMRVLSTGGDLSGSSLSLVGQSACTALKRFTADKAIISCKGIDFNKGLTETGVAEAEVKMAMAENAKEVILAIDSSKFGRLAFAASVDIGRVAKAVSDSFPNEWRRHFGEIGVVCV